MFLRSAANAFWIGNKAQGRYREQGLPVKRTLPFHSGLCITRTAKWIWNLQLDSGKRPEHVSWHADTVLDLNNSTARKKKTITEFYNSSSRPIAPITHAWLLQSPVRGINNACRHLIGRQRIEVPMFFFSQRCPSPSGKVQRLWRYRIPKPAPVGQVGQVAHAHQQHLTFYPCHTTLGTL